MSDPAAQIPAPADCAAFGHYLVRRLPDGSLVELGRGAMGVTYRGFDPGLRKPVAIKVIASAYVHDETTRRRFQREARSAAQLTHPHVAGVLHLGEQNGEYFYAMEFVAGRPLSALLREQRVPPVEVTLALLAQVAAALSAAHKRELIHRDLKPANLMILEGEAVDHEDERITAAGGRQIKVVDFGLARSFGSSRLDDSLATQSTNAAAFTGTPAYASPEQCAGSSELDGRSDLYSLGIILWQCLTGKLPFTGTAAQVLGMQQYQPPPMAQLAGLPVVLVEMLAGLLEKDPAERRPQTAGKLRDALDAARREMEARPGAFVSVTDETKPLPASAPTTDSAHADLALGATSHEPTTSRRPAGFEPAPAAPAGRQVPAGAGIPTWLTAAALLPVAGALLWFARDRFSSAAPAGKTAAPPAVFSVGSEKDAPRRFADAALGTAKVLSDATMRAFSLRYIGDGQARAGDERAEATFVAAAASGRQIPELRDRIGTLRALAGAMRQAGVTQTARTTLLETRELISSGLTEKAVRNYEAQELAFEFARLGDAAGAKSCVDLIGDATGRFYATSMTAAEFATQGNTSAARDLARSIEDANWRSTAFARVATALARKGDVAGATATLNEIANDFERSTPSEEVLRAKAKAAAAAGDLGGARKWEGQLREPAMRGSAQVQIALALARAGNVPAAREQFAAARATVAELPANGLVESLREIALAQFQGGDREGCRATLEQIRSAIAGMAETNRRTSQILFGQTLAKCGETAAARELMATVENANFRRSIRSSLMVSLCKAGDFQTARQVADEVVKAEPVHHAFLIYVLTVFRAWQEGPIAAEGSVVSSLNETPAICTAYAGLLQVAARQARGQKRFADEDFPWF